MWLSASPRPTVVVVLPSRRRRRHRGDEDELAVGLALERVEVLERDLRLVVAVGVEMVLGDAELLERHLGDALELRGLGNLDVGRHGGTLLFSARRR